MSNRIYPNIQRPIIPVDITRDQKKSMPVNQNERGSFASFLEQELDKTREVRFSKHAEQRLETRNIQLTNEQMQEIGLAVDKAEKKGIRDSLILMKDMAFIVNIPSRVVVTAMDEQGIKENVFTNIDGAVIL